MPKQDPTHEHSWQFDKWKDVPLPSFDKANTDWDKIITVMLYVCDCGDCKFVQPKESIYVKAE